MAKTTTAEQRAEIARQNGKLGGRPPKYKTPEELEDAINAYFEGHTDKSNAPKWHQMLNEINLSNDTLLRYRTEERYIKAGFADVVKRAENKHSAFWQQLALDNPNLQTFCIFQLKQPHNGGLSDKQVSESTGEHKIDITINGI